MGRALIGCCPVATANQSSPHSGPILSCASALTLTPDPTGGTSISSILPLANEVHCLTNFCCDFGEYSYVYSRQQIN